MNLQDMNLQDMHAKNFLPVLVRYLPVIASAIHPYPYYFEKQHQFLQVQDEVNPQPEVSEVITLLFPVCKDGLMQLRLLPRICSRMIECLLPRSLECLHGHTKLVEERSTLVTRKVIVTID
jgi:hypothetical protein